MSVFFGCDDLCDFIVGILRGMIFIGTVFDWRIPVTGFTHSHEGR